MVLQPTDLVRLSIAALMVGCQGNGSPTDDTSSGTNPDPTQTGVVWDDFSYETSASFTDLYLTQGQVWTSATTGVVQVLTGDTWTQFNEDTEPALDVDGNDLYGIWGLESTIVAVGTNGTIATHNGSSWTVDDIGTPNLDAIDGNGVGNLMVAGWGGVYRNAAGSFDEPDAIEGNPLINDIWFDGQFGLAVGEGGARAAFGGAAWNIDPESESRSLYGIDGLSLEDAWAVGEAGAAFHYDGAGWESVETGTNASLWAVWMAATDRVFAVGANGTAIVYDGKTWSPLSTGTRANLYAVTGTSADEVWAGGSGGALIRYIGG